MTKKKQITIIIVLFLSFIAFYKFVNSFAIKTFSKYYSSSLSSIEFGIAIPIIEDTVEEITIPLDSMVPGMSTEYNFSVMNFDENNVESDTSFEYTINVSTAGYLPLNLELQKDGILNNILVENSTPTYILSHNILTTHNYKLIISWPNEYDNFLYANSLELVTITISAVQKVS